MTENFTFSIKSSKSKVQTSIQGDEVRVSGKKRDDLQAAIKLIKELNIKHPLQYENFRDQNFIIFALLSLLPHEDEFTAVKNLSK